MVSKMSSKGQIVIPAELRQELKILPGTRIEIKKDKKPGQLVLTALTDDFINSLAGKYKKKGAFKAYLKERHIERSL